MRTATVFLSACALALGSLFAVPGANEVNAGPFFLRRGCPPGGCQTPHYSPSPNPSKDSSPPTLPNATGQSPGSREEMQVVPQPWLLAGQTDVTSSQQPDTVLEPVEGTGSRLGIGAKVPDKITHTLDPATIAALKDALKNSLPATPSVPITLPLDQPTTERLSRISMALELLAWLGTGIFGGSAVGKLLPLAARVANGLLSATAAASRAATQTAVAPSSQAPSPLPAANLAAPSSTQTPVS